MRFSKEFLQAVGIGENTSIAEMEATLMKVVNENKELKAQRKQTALSHVEAAISEGRLDEAMREAWEQIAETSPMAVMESMKSLRQAKAPIRKDWNLRETLMKYNAADSGNGHGNGEKPKAQWDFDDLVRKPKVIEYAYDQLESVISGHRKKLMSYAGERAAHAYSPQADTSDTPVIATTGADDGDGIKKITIADILKLKERYDLMEVPLDKRFLVLHPKHVSQLIEIDLDSFKDIVDFVNGVPRRFAGFNILQFTRNATYNKTTLEKVAFGAAAAPSTDTYSSFSFHSDEVMKADGETKLYEEFETARERATIVGFEKRFIAVPIRNKAVGSIVGAPTA